MFQWLVCFWLIYVSVQMDSTERKRWYKEVRVASSHEHVESMGQSSKSFGIEINLDQKKLRTPNGKLLLLPNPILAAAVAEEWQCQGEKIRRSEMHLTSLCSKATDNPEDLKPEDLVSKIVDFIPTDTVMFRVDEPEDLSRLSDEGEMGSTTGVV
ncbi:unnamed protein product [Cyprideis torosa]|uniref:Uncharacterized protein n=1 Tax=Cyprideis torosa TaxID=163714 RepID=A0A7R8ZNQ3_9CRUS|nr:unnamed protein product [Cyprideis torosa]CAG0896879.1 unnamed protein product [Cyprideis torosa]